MSKNSSLFNYDTNTSWALIPSDPAIFNDMIDQYGVKNTRVEEVFSLDFEDLTRNGSVHGLMFVSRYVEEELPEGMENSDPESEDVVFTAQVVTNVCGTLALLAILLNANIEKGTILENFLHFTRGFSAINRGLCLGNSKEIRSIHDAYATNASHSAETAMMVAAEASDENDEYVDADTFHYVSYIYKNGFLWELDGLKGQPIKLAACEEETWLEAVKPVLEKRMNSSVDNELTFNLMAVTNDPYENLIDLQKSYLSCKNRLKKVTSKTPETVSARQLKQLYKYVESLNVPLITTIKYVCEHLDDEKVVEEGQQEIRSKIQELESRIKMLKEQKDAEKVDATRQKFDYFPVINFLLKRGLERGLVPSKKREREEDDDGEENVEENPQKKSKRPTKTPKTSKKKKLQKN